jgi:hypothetical protein
LRALAGELVRLQPSRRDPEAYHVAKDRIASEIRKAAVEVDWSHPKLSAVPASARERREITRPARRWLSGDARCGLRVRSDAAC